VLPQNNFVGNDRFAGLAMEATWLHVVPLIIPRKHRDFNGLENVLLYNFTTLRTIVR